MGTSDTERHSMEAKQNRLQWNSNSNNNNNIINENHWNKGMKKKTGK